MNIGFEAKRVFMNFTGLGNYGRFIIDSLSEFHPENQYFLYTPRLSDSAELKPILDKKNVHVVSPEGIYTTPGFSSVWRSWAVANHKTVQSLSIFHGLSQELPVGLPSHVKKIVTVHDLIFLRYPRFYNPIDVKIYTTKVKHACENADCVVAISQQTANDIVSYLKVPASKVKIVYQGCHPIFRRAITPEAIENARTRYKLPEKYLLTVGTVEERKNLVTLIRALGSLPVKGRIPLVVLGRQTRYMSKVKEEIEKHKIKDLVHFIEDARFPDFPAIYKASAALVYPSLFEGFGIPLVEAIECEVPVITSKGSCFSEAAGPDSMYADPFDHDAIAKHITTVLTDQRSVSERITRSRQYVHKFHPRFIAAEMMSVYKSVL